MALAAAGAGLAQGDAHGVSLAPIKDNTILQSTNPASQLSGGQGDLFVGRTGQDGQGPPVVSIRRALVAFDLSVIPAHVQITGVTLTVRDVQGLNGDQTVALHRLQQDWGEGSSAASAPAANNDATWLYTFYNAANPASSPTWNTPGGSYAETPSASRVINDDNGPNQLFTWSSLTNPQMLIDVQSWYANPATNFGWILIGNEAAGNTAKRFSSGESNVAPVLEVSYILPEPGSVTLVVSALAGLGAVRRRR